MKKVDDGGVAEIRFTYNERYHLVNVHAANAVGY
jgi:hypothetical protein